MHNPSKTISLTRRVIDHFLMYSLGCLFLTLVLVVTLQWQGLLISHLHLVVVLPLICIGLGVTMFRSMFRVTGDIDSQIRNLAIAPDAHQLNPIYRPDSLALGWNLLIEKIGEQAVSESLESRISKSMGEMQGQKHQLVFDCFPDGLVLTDSEGLIIQSNRVFPVLLYLENDFDFIGQSLASLLKISQLENGDEILQKTEQQIASLVFEIKPIGSKSESILRVARQKLINNDGSEECFLWSFRDVTQAKLAEEMRNQFVFTATHELRTPLTNIKAYAETLALDEQIELEDQKKFCNIINSEVTRLGRFVDELLNVSQMEAGALALTLQETNLERLFNEVIEHNKPQMDKKQIHFTSIIPAKLPEIPLDKDKITASLVNLLGNAIKYTPVGGHVSFNVLQQGKSIVIEIEDDGYGISKEEASQVFDKFFRSADKRVRSIEGSGLGLAFAKEAIRLHGGQLDLLSELNKGSKFILTLPT